jgi:hypothetical protein
MCAMREGRLCFFAVFAGGSLYWGGVQQIGACACKPCLLLFCLWGLVYWELGEARPHPMGPVFVNDAGGAASTNLAQTIHEPST